MRKSGFFGEFGGLEEVVCGTSFSSPDQGRPEKEKRLFGRKQLKDGSPQIFYFGGLSKERHW